MFGWIKFWKKKTKFPCEDCLVLPKGCKHLCNKVEMDNEKLRWRVKSLSRKDKLVCPDCGNTDWYGGPCGGLSQNIMCSKCKHEFNIGAELIVFERI